MNFDNMKHEILSDCLIMNIEKKLAKKVHLKSIINDFSTI